MAQPIIDCAVNVKCRKVEILNVFLEVETVPFNRGFYSVDITFFFAVHLSAYTSPAAPPTPVQGLATFSKKVILFGSEGNVRVFSSDSYGPSKQRNNLPKASVQVVDPICLACRLMECPEFPTPCCGNVPQDVCCQYEGNFSVCNPVRTVFITLGLFTIVQLERSVQMMIPAYDFCVPDKECTTTADDPCELFKRIKFPTNEFFPPRMDDLECPEIPSCGCETREE